MTGFNHTLAGCIVAVIVPAPLVPFVAFLSHFVLDALPHFGQDERFVPYNRNFKIILTVDAMLCVAALGLSIVLFPDKWFILAVGAFFATLPDFMWLLDGKIKWLRPFFRFATVIQWGEFPRGWILEALYGAVFTVVLFSL